MPDGEPEELALLSEAEWFRRFNEAMQPYRWADEKEDCLQKLAAAMDDPVVGPLMREGWRRAAEIAARWEADG